VEFGIYLQHRLQREREAGAHGAEGLARALGISSRALAWNVTVLAGGFLVLLLSDLRPNRDLGLLLAAATLGSYFACLLLLPRLLLLTVPLILLCAAPALAEEPMAAVEPAAKAEVKAERECPAEESPALTERMKAAERVVREQPRLFRMEIEANYNDAGGPAAPALGRMVPNTIWGAVRPDGDATRLLYVFSGPGRLAKTSLLLRDFTAAETEDETWLYLRSFDTFRRLEGAVEQTLVPGSALSYEDARGFVATSRYRFAALEPAADGAPRVLACPRTPEIAERLGYGRLYIELDASEPLVRRIDYRGLGGAPLKVYEVETTTRFEGTLLPARVALLRKADGLDNAILYEYWKPGKPLPDRLFSTDLEKDGPFVARLRDVASDAGVLKELDEELARAQAIVDEHDKLWNPGQESKPESKPKKK
jgi:hypothetical protein